MEERTIITDDVSPELLALLNHTAMVNSELMGVLFQMIFAITDERWEELWELTFLYGSGLKEDNVCGRQLFVNLVNFLRNKQRQSGSY